jgi:hypothetical protein
VADDPSKIMAALLQSYATPKANISKAIKTIKPPPSTSILSHNLAATSLSTLSNNPKQKQPNNHLPHQEPKLQPTSKGQKEAQKTHDKAIGKQL